MRIIESIACSLSALIQGASAKADAPTLWPGGGTVLSARLRRNGKAIPCGGNTVPPLPLNFADETASCLFRGEGAIPPEASDPVIARARAGGTAAPWGFGGATGRPPSRAFARSIQAGRGKAKVKSKASFRRTESSVENRSPSKALQKGESGWPLMPPEQRRLFPTCCCS